MKRPLRYGVLFGLLAGAVGWWATAPERVPEAQFAALRGDVARGEIVFWAGGCAACHSPPQAEGTDRIVLSGGRSFVSDFGTFYAPNISPDPEHGLGTWKTGDLANAMLHGTSPAGQHYYPAFPYTSYARASPQDVADLWTFLQTLPASDIPSKAHEVGFPFSIRRALGGWKILFGGPPRILTGNLSPEAARGRDLVEGLGHCGECHSPRNALGGIDYDRWLGGAPNPSGKGKIPNITPAKLDWSETDLVEYFTSGFTPEYDSAGGEMAEVVQNLAHLPLADRQAIAAYLKAVPAVE
ncbi:Nicotinate dehydrogenase subunit B [Thalassovita gelatinovora]|uniref:Nicotinate dehydrogenase subunit B n=1 Tax=Thalassovita gelatinovora TaxID=53501 RepID=A0A0P1FR45_THAGE|nr:cytochrome c [Thalassovita gelatinovora]QIZ79305.1 c-type cytochrome [Thalassovita gelatinovora]CUH62540.1 Nicotinate dehydrogenase subunit B [Thalassovita gelatinovora]SEQ06212.1 Cytochrome c, mono-and diheme variants [Thalassovita gelatinovora]